MVHVKHLVLGPAHGEATNHGHFHPFFSQVMRQVLGTHLPLQF